MDTPAYCVSKTTLPPATPLIVAGEVQDIVVAPVFIISTAKTVSVGYATALAKGKLKLFALVVLISMIFIHCFIILYLKAASQPVSYPKNRLK